MDGSLPRVEIPAPIREYVRKHSWEYVDCFLENFPGQQEAVVAALVEKVGEELTREDRADFDDAIRALNHPQVPVAPFHRRLAELSEKSKRYGEDARALLGECGEETQAYAQELFARDDVVSRLSACTLLYASEREEAMTWLKAQRSQVDDPKLLAYFDHVVLCGKARSRVEIEEYLKEQVRVHSPQLHAPLSSQAMHLFQASIAALRDAKIQESGSAGKWKPRRLSWYQEQLEGMQLDGKDSEALHGIVEHTECELWSEFFAHPDVTYLHLVRMLVLSGRLQSQQEFRGSQGGGLYWAHPMLGVFAAAKGSFSMDQLFAACSVVGASDEVLLHQLITSFCSVKKAILPAEQVAQLCERGSMLFIREFGIDPMRPSDRIMIYGEWWDERKAEALYLLASHFSEPSEYLQAQLVQRALTLPEKEAVLVRDCLRARPGSETMISACLQRSKAKERICAAKWLVLDDCKSEIPKLEARLRVEKDAGVRVALTDALLALGHSLEEELTPESWLKEALRRLPKKTPSKLAWIPMDLLPAMRWHDSEEQVPQELVRWWIFSACKRDEARPGPLFRKYLSLVQVEDARAFGHALLVVWLLGAKDYFDGRKLSDEQKQQEILALCAIPGLDSAKAAQAIKAYEALGKTSISGSKGILALVSACDAIGAVEMMRDYVLESASSRSALCTQLVLALGNMDNLAAIGATIAIASKIRTRSVQECAEEQLPLILARKGWTFDELSDRTISHCGLSEQGTATLDLGGRLLTMKLDEEFKLSLVDEKGRARSTMAPARKADDPALYALAKKSFSSCKKAVKKVVKEQKERLEEAMFAEREWSKSNLEQFILKHPVVGTLASSLLWVELSKEGQTRFFRPLADRTLSDLADQSIQLDPQSQVQLAHAGMMDAEALEAWKSHFKDYEVTSIFPQFDALEFTLQEEQEEITKYPYSRKVEYLQLRNMCQRAGFFPEPAMDDGSIFAFERRFRGMGLRAQLCFSGWCPRFAEKLEEVELQGLMFYKAGEDGEEKPLELQKVSPILLSRCIQLLQDICAEG